MAEQDISHDLNLYFLSWLVFVSVLPAAEEHLTFFLFDSAGLEMEELSMKRCLDLINRMVLRVLTIADGPQTDKQTDRQMEARHTPSFMWCPHQSWQ